MSAKHPIISVTGSSGAGTTSVRRTFEQIFRREGIAAAFIEGDAFHRYDRQGMKDAMADEMSRGNLNFSHFGAGANLLEELEALFREYSERGVGRRRHYVHNADESEKYGQPAGTFTAWEELPNATELLCYEGLHGAVVTDAVNTARYADLKIGVVPVINLEWIQKIHRDKQERGHSEEAIVDTILRRMPDYVHFICPQFTQTDINFQRVPTVDTSNPFIARWIPTPDESMVVIRFRNPRGI
ncbi:MAG: phosphoribulokinase, partial [Hyphomicrobiales bacterium]|nr:phosphoribulokinase [Hyphomicrobiales bacterium]